MTVKTSPCKNCTDRVLSCHSNCTKYAEWKNEVDEYKKTITQGKLLQRELDERKKDAVYRLTKYRKKY